MSFEENEGGIVLAIKAWGGGEQVDYTASNIAAYVSIDGKQEKALGCGNVEFKYDLSGLTRVTLDFSFLFEFHPSFNTLYQTFRFEDGKLLIENKNRAREDYMVTLTQR